MDLLTFIWTVDPTKLRVAERQRVEYEPRLLESTTRRVVPLLPIAPARASNELEASADKLFYKEASGDGQGTDIQLVVATTDTIVEDVALLQPRRQRKRKTVVADASGPSHPPKKLREDYGALGGASTAGKSRFVISLDSSHHSDANIAKAEVDSIIKSSALAIATVTTVTATIDADATSDRVPVAPSLFGVGSSSTGRTDSVPGGFFDVSGSDFLIGGIRTVVDPDSDLQKVYAELLKVRDREIASLKAQLLLKEREKNELSVKVIDLSALVKVREQEVPDLEARVTTIKLQNDNLVDRVHELKISSVGLQEKVVTYEDFIGQLEKFQDKNGGRAAISKAVEKGMQEGLSAGITHGAKGRKLADVAVYNPSAEADYLSALQRLQNVNFSLIAELKSKKDASVDTIMNLFRLDDALAERLGLTESQPHANQLMVHIHHSLDQRVVGASALSLSLDVSHSQFRKIRENIASHVSALRGVFVPLSEPLSAAALEGGAGVDDETAAVGNINLFSDVSNAELNILE
nr:nonaspanin [Tanacetum cinerariifolium]